ncbi:MAG: PEP-CTERM sorting domain-containing protein [Rhodoferax sp.]
MSIKQLVAGVFLSASLSMASAAVVQYDAFSLSFDETTQLGYPSFSTSGGGGSTGFGWSLPSSIKVISLGGGAVETTFTLPTFTITAKPGWTLSGPLSSFIGNVVFNEVGSGALTTMTATGQLSFDGGPSVPVGGALSKIVTTDETDVRSGFFADTADTSHGGFQSLTVSAASLTLRAEGGVYASILAQPQNVLQFGIIAAPVPEPESWALLMAGLGLVGYAAHRRSARR